MPEHTTEGSLVGSIALSRLKINAFSGSKFHVVTMFVTLITKGISYMMCRYVYELGIETDGEHL